MGNKVHVATAMSFPTNAGLIFLKDELTSDNFLVDTGATLSIVPYNAKASPSGPTLNGANGLPIPTWGTVTKFVRFQGITFKHTFLQAAVAGPILGIDFLKKIQCYSRPGFKQGIVRNNHMCTKHGPLQQSNCPVYGGYSAEKRPWHFANNSKQSH